MSLKDSNPINFLLDGTEEEVIWKARYNLLRVFAFKYAEENGTAWNVELDKLRAKYGI
jgi:hypothetical protein